MDSFKTNDGRPERSGRSNCTENLNSTAPTDSPISSPKQPIFTLQEWEHLATLVKNDLSSGGNAYQYWSNRLLDKINAICLEKQKEVQKALQELEQQTNWTKALSKKQ